MKARFSMRIAKSCAVLTSILALGAALPACAQKINLPPVTRVSWPNGVKVILMEYHRAPTLSVTALFPGGASLDPAGKIGVASMTADLMRKGTDTRTAPQIAEQIDFLGGSLGAAAGNDSLVVSLGVLAKDTKTGLDLFTDIIRHPTFPAEELERERQLSVAGLESLKEDPAAVASRVEEEIAYPGHPYGYESTITSLKALTRDDLAAYYHRVVAPNRMILVAVGDFKTADMLANLRGRFGNWAKVEGAAADVPPVKPTARRIVLIDKPDATQTQVRMVRTAFPRSSSDYFAASVANTILGGGFTSRLTDEIRVNRSLTYGIDSGFVPRLRGGTFGISSFSKVETTRALLDATRDVLAKTAAKGFTPGELKKVKGYMTGLYAIRVQTPEALASQLEDMALYGLPNNYMQTYLNRIQSITLADANRIAKTYFSPEKLSIVLVAPASKVAAQLKGINGIETRSIDTVGK
jgi:zinc protease